MYSNKAGLLATGVWSSDSNVPIVDHNIFDYKICDYSFNYYFKSIRYSLN